MFLPSEPNFLSQPVGTGFSQGTPNVKVVLFSSIYPARGKGDLMTVLTLP